MAQIAFKDVRKSYGEQEIIKGLNLTIEKGEIFVLVGPSGSGKTSTLKMINGLSKPSAGQIFYKDQAITSYDLKKMRWQMGYVLQQIALFPNMNVAQNIMVIPEMLGWPKEKQQKEVDRLLASVDLEPASYRKRMPAELSGGERQRVGILRAIAANPEVILMDEPFSALDPISRNDLQDLVLHLHQQLGTTVVFVTHNMEEAVKLGDRIGVMKDGVLLQVDTPQGILKNPNSDFISDFFSETQAQSLTHSSLAEILPMIQLADFTAAEVLPNCSVATPLTEVFNQLAQTEALLVTGLAGEKMGKLTRAQMFQFLAAS